MKKVIKRALPLFLILALMLTLSACSASQQHWQEIFQWEASQGTVTVYSAEHDYDVFFQCQLKFELRSTEGEVQTYITKNRTKLFAAPTFKYMCDKEGMLDVYFCMRFIEEETAASAVTFEDVVPPFTEIIWDMLVNSQVDGFWESLGKALLSLFSDIVDNIFSFFDFIDQVLSSSDPAGLMAEKFIEIVAGLDSTREDAIKQALESVGGQSVESYADLLYSTIAQHIAGK